MRPETPLLSLHPEKTVIQKDTCTSVFIASLFTIASIWKQTTCPSTEEWTEKIWYIYTMEYYLAIKENEVMPCAATQMHLEITTLSEIIQKEED